MEYESKKKFIINVLYIVTIAAVVYFIIKYAIWWVAPFLVGLLLVAIMQPLSKLVTKIIPLKNKGATFFSLVILYVIIGLLLWFGVALIVDKCSLFVSKIPEIYETYLLPMLQSLNDWAVGIATRFAPDTADFISKMSNTFTDELASFLGEFSKKSVNAVTSHLTQLPMYLIALVFSVMSSVFISLNYPDVKAFIVRQFPEKGQAMLQFLHSFVKGKILKVLKAYMLIMLITFAENAIGLSILGAEHAIAIAAIIAICDILPILGSGTILIPWGVIKLCSGDLFMGIGLLIMYVVIMIVRNAIEPKIVGTQIGLHPIVTITAMYAGLKIFGFVGFFLAPITVLFLIQLNNEGYIKLWK